MRMNPAGIRQAWMLRFAGMGPFSVIWSGQVATLVGSGMTKFAFIVYMWKIDGSATRIALLAVFAFLPRMLLSPLAGALVDRWRRKTVLQATDLAGLLAMSTVAVTYFAGELQAWHVYIAVAILGAGEAFQFPAFSAAVTTLVAKEQVTRANGMLATARSAADVCGPALGGVLVVAVGLGAVLVADVVTFMFALVTIWLVAIRDPKRSTPAGGERPTLFADSFTGLRRIFGNPSLRGLGLIFFAVNLGATFGFAVLPSMILARSGDHDPTLAMVMTATGVGGILGGSLLVWWGGPKNHVRAMMWGIIGTSVIGQIVMAVVTSPPLWILAELIGAALIPIINGSLQTIIQRRIPEDQQGRVFGGVIFIAQVAAPIGFGVAGPVADRVFEPAARNHSGPIGLLTPVFGDGRGSGIAMVLALGGVLGVIAATAGLLNRSLRQIDTLLPEVGEEPADHPEEASGNDIDDSDALVHMAAGDVEPEASHR